METQRLRRRRSRRRARKRQIAALIVVALVIGVFVWSRILIERKRDGELFAEQRAAAVAPGERPTPAVRSAAATATKSLILFVGSGYGIVPMTAARIHAVGEDGQLAIDRLPETALVRTSSKNAQAADSAAAMSAYMTGVKVENRVLSQSTDTRAFDETGLPHAIRGESTCPSAGNGAAVPTLLELARASGRATGVVTTARVTRAIAAASYAHLCHRDGENTIAGQLVPGGPGVNPRLGEGLDVVLGGGWQHFLPKDDPRGSSRSDGRDLLAEMRAKGYAVITRQAELGATAQPIGRLLGLFNRSHMQFDGERLGTNEPSLAEMTTRAIDLLQRNANGYVLVVEGGRIGEAFDGAMAKKALQEARAFDEAITVALERVRQFDPELRNTTVVATADHDHTLILNGNSTLVGRTVESRPGVLGVLKSYAEPTQFATDATGRPFTALVFGTGERRVRGPRSQAPALNDLAANDRNLRYESVVETPSGTEAIGGADVLLAAAGANAARFHGTIENTRVFTLLREAMGL